MHNQIAEILNYAQNAARYRWTAIIVAWVICLFGWLFVAQLPDRFQAEARVRLDTKSILRPLLTGMVIQPDLSAQLRLMSKLMFSRPNLEKVARMTDLDIGVATEAAKERLIKRLQSSMTITGGESDLFTIAYQDQDPKVSERVVQALLSIFLDQTLGVTHEDSTSAQQFLDQEIKDYESRLVTAEKALEEFKRANYGLLPEQGGKLYDQLGTLNGNLEAARMALLEASNRRDAIKKQLEEDGPSYVDSTGLPVPQDPLDLRIQALQTRLDELSLKYTKDHPEIIALQGSLVDLLKQKEQGTSAIVPANSDPVSKARAVSNPLYQQRKMALGEQEANIASLSSRIKVIEEKIAGLKRQMEERLKVETRLQGLNRDYETIKTNFNQLLARREQARMSESVEEHADMSKFKVIDPPRADSKPAAPNRILLSTGVLVAGLGAGIGLAVFLSLLRPPFTTAQKLREITGVPVLGTVTMNWMPEVKRQKWLKLVAFGASFAALFLLFVGVVVLAVKGYHLPPLISKAV